MDPRLARIAIEARADEREADPVSRLLAIEAFTAGRERRRAVDALFARSGGRGAARETDGGGVDVVIPRRGRYERYRVDAEGRMTLEEQWRRRLRTRVRARLLWPAYLCLYGGMLVLLVVYGGATEVHTLGSGLLTAALLGGIVLSVAAGEDFVADTSGWTIHGGGWLNDDGGDGDGDGGGDGGD